MAATQIRAGGQVNPVVNNHINGNEPTKFVQHFFNLNQAAEARVRSREVNFGFGDFSKFIFKRTYARKKDDGTTESWHDTSIRVANGSGTYLKNHLLKNGLRFELPVPDAKDEFAQEMSCEFESFDKIVEEIASKITDLKLVPAGRSLWAGGPLAYKVGSMVLNNCGASTTKDLRSGATWTMDALMLGCGVGFDVEFEGPVYPANKEDTRTYVIPDTREGWVESFGLLIDAYTKEGAYYPEFDYSKIRPLGSPIRTFGGTASGPAPLKKLHHRVKVFFETYIDMERLNHRMIEDGSLYREVNPKNYRIHKTMIFYQLVEQIKKTDFSDDSKLVARLKVVVDKLIDVGSKGINKKTVDEMIDILSFESAWIGEYGPRDSIVDRVVEHMCSLESRILGKNLTATMWFAAMDDFKQCIEITHQAQVDAKISKIKGLMKDNIQLKTYDLVRLTEDIMNSIGACVVAGNVRRSSMLAKGRPDCKTFKYLKDWQINPERAKIAAMSNNTVEFTSTSQYAPHLPACAKQTALRGEPGYFFKLNAQRYGRTAVHKPVFPDSRELEADDAIIPNPCGEIGLLSKELCLLIETALNRFLRKNKLAGSRDGDLDSMFDLDDLLHCCKLAVIYAKSVSVLPTHNPDTNAIIMRNHRIGISPTGGAQVHDVVGATNYIKILRAMYRTIRQTDRWISRILGVRESIRLTTCKPSGTISLLTGSTAGVHFCHSRYVHRRVRIAATSEYVPFLEANGYKGEPDAYADNTLVFSFGLDYGPVRSVQEVTMYEQLKFLEMHQQNYADNMVSCTVTFDREREGHLLEYAIAQFAPTLKSVSFLPNEPGVYKQMPLETTDLEGYNKLNKPLDWSLLETGKDTNMPRGCTSERCQLAR